MSYYRPIKIGDKVYGTDSDLKRGDYSYLDGVIDVKDKTILDLGAAAGGLSFHFRDEMKESTSIDHSERCNRGAKVAFLNNIKNIMFIKTDAWDFLEDNIQHYDIVFCLNFLHWIENPKHILDHIHECCNDKLVLEVPRTVIKLHKNAWTTETYEDLYAGYITKYKCRDSCDGPRDGLVVDIGRMKADQILSKRTKGSGSIRYKLIDEEIIVYEPPDKKKWKNPLIRRFKGIKDIPKNQIKSKGKWYMGKRSDLIIEDYRRDMKTDIFPPIIVYTLNNKYYIADGNHRHAASEDMVNAIILGE